MEDNNLELVELFNGRLKLYQHPEGYRFSIDAVLLAHFAAQRATGTVVDLGTGNGILPVILARSARCGPITGVEIQPGLAELARRNISLNGCTDRVSVLHADINTIRSHLAPESCDSVITNPPFYRAGSGKVNPDSQNAIARHELFGTLQDFIATSAFLLRQTGRLLAVYLPARLVDLIAEMRRRNIEPKTIRFVHSRIDEPAVMVLVEGVKNAGVEAAVLAPLVLYDSAGNYTPETCAVFEAI